MSLVGAPVNEGNINNLRDILQTYNRITEICFRKCVSNLNYRDLTDTETSCVSSCAGKHIMSNHRIMGTFMELQLKRQQQMTEEMASQAAGGATVNQPSSTSPALPSPTTDTSTSVVESADIPSGAGNKGNQSGVS